MKKNNIKINKQIKYYFNENFFKTESEESFYWAGFIAADGCLSDFKMKSRNTINHKLIIGLADKDKCHLELFLKNINSNHPINKRIIKNSNKNNNPKYKYKYKDSLSVNIVIYSESFFEDLSKFNIIPRKTLKLKFPEWLINHKFVHHFMRGYVDGDGCWSLRSRKAVKQAVFNIIGTKEFITTFRLILENNNVVPKNDNEIKMRDKIATLSYEGNRLIPKIRDFLYKDATVYLQRKYDKVKNIQSIR